VSGAWEIRQHTSVLTAILHTDVCTIPWAIGFKNLHLPGPVILLAGMPYDHARNSACQRLLQSDCQYLFFLDSDVVPPPDAVLRLLSHKLPIVSGMYCRRSPPAAVPVMLNGGQWVTKFPPNALMEVELVGAGCLLIHRSVLERVPPQRPGNPPKWFDWRVDMNGVEGMGPYLSEDFTFNVHVRNHGYKVIVDTGIQCKHIGLGQATYGQFEPATC
jgi:hypothetical protein